MTLEVGAGEAPLSRSGRPLWSSHGVHCVGEVGAMFFIGSGPSELHAHIDLGHHVSQYAGPGRVAVSVVAVTQHAGHWSIVAESHTAGEGR